MLRTRDYKAKLEEYENQYQEARDDVFDQEFTLEFVENNTLMYITEDDIQGFLDSFTFPDEADWCAIQVQNELETIGDIKYQEWKDRDI